MVMLNAALVVSSRSSMAGLPLVTQAAYWAMSTELPKLPLFSLPSRLISAVHDMWTLRVKLARAGHVGMLALSTASHSLA